MSCLFTKRAGSGSVHWQPCIDIARGGTVDESRRQRLPTSVRDAEFLDIALGLFADGIGVATTVFPKLRP